MKKTAIGVDAIGSTKTLVWKLNVKKADVASVRYRCLFPLFGLQEKGISSIVLGSNDGVRDFSQVEALIIVKSFTDYDVKLCVEATSKDVPVFIDLCDNIFVEEYGGVSGSRIRENFLTMARHARAIVTTGPALAGVIRENVGPHVPVEIVHDQVETRDLTIRALDEETWQSDPFNLRVQLPRSWHLVDIKVAVGRVLRRFRRSIKLARALPLRLFGLAKRVLRRVLCFFGFEIYAQASTEGPSLSDEPHYEKTIVWFGHHGSAYGNYGLASVAKLCPTLERVNDKIPIRLLIISDNESLFNRTFSASSFPVEYRPWSLLSIFDDLEEADVCIVPNSLDAFSVTKSANRVIMALAAGVPVVATEIPSLKPLRGSIGIDRWDDGILLYLTDPLVSALCISKGRELISEHYSACSISNKWIELLRRFSHQRF